MKLNEELEKRVKQYAKYTLIVGARQGLHCRNAGDFAKIANKYSGEIYVQKNDIIVSGRSIMGILTLEAILGTELTLYLQPTGDHNEIYEMLQDVANKNYNDSPCSYDFNQ